MRLTGWRGYHLVRRCSRLKWPAPPLSFGPQVIFRCCIAVSNLSALGRDTGESNQSQSIVFSDGRSLQPSINTHRHVTCTKAAFRCHLIDSKQSATFYITVTNYPFGSKFEHEPCQHTRLHHRSSTDIATSKVTILALPNNAYRAFLTPVR